MKKYIVYKSLEYLKNILNHAQYKGGPDKSILIDAMSDYIKFSDSQIGMPILVKDGIGEYLQDGQNLLQALEKSKFDKEVACLWYSKNPKDLSSEYSEYSLLEAEKIGSDARVITFNSIISDTWMEKINAIWNVRPEIISLYSIGWDESKVAELGGWLSWRKEVEHVSKNIQSVVAINGRFFSELT